MKAASMLFGCVGLAGSAQEEDKVCENILQRNVVLIISFGSSGIFSMTFDASKRVFQRVRQSSQNRIPATALQSFPGHHYPANLGTIIHIPPIPLRSSLILLISTKEGPWTAGLQSDKSWRRVTKGPGLRWAATKGNHRRFSSWLKYKTVEPDSKDKEGRTSLAFAVKERHETVIQLLLKQSDAATRQEWDSRQGKG